jgi:predicted protein tyrosine phosphatase
MILEHLSREKAEAYRDERRYAVISITDPDGPEAKLQDDPNRLAVLRLQFHDFTQTEEEFAAIFQEAEPPEWVDDEPAKGWILPTAVHAEAIVGFYRSLPPEVEKVVIHCEAGVSRSAAVGAALAHCLGQNDRQFYDKSFPNHRVRRLVIEAWRRSTPTRRERDGSRG